MLYEKIGVRYLFQGGEEMRWEFKLQGLNLFKIFGVGKLKFKVKEFKKIGYFLILYVEFFYVLVSLMYILEME